MSSEELNWGDTAAIVSARRQRREEESRANAATNAFLDAAQCVIYLRQKLDENIEIANYNYQDAVKWEARALASERQSSALQAALNAEMSKARSVSQASWRNNAYNGAFLYAQRTKEEVILKNAGQPLSVSEHRQLVLEMMAHWEFQHHVFVDTATMMRQVRDRVRNLASELEEKGEISEAGARELRQHMDYLERAWKILAGTKEGYTLEDWTTERLEELQAAVQYAGPQDVLPIVDSVPAFLVVDKRSLATGEIGREGVDVALLKDPDFFEMLKHTGR